MSAEPQGANAGGGGDTSLAATSKTKKKKSPPTPEETEHLKSAVAQFDHKKWDEIARWMQTHKRFESSCKQAPLHVALTPHKEHSSVRQYLTGKALRKIVASKTFAAKFGLTFTRENAAILLVPMMNLAAAKPSMKRNLGKRYFVQTEPWQREPVVKLRLSQLRAPGSRYSTTEVIEDELYVWTFEGSVLWRHILLGGLIGCFLLACLFPVWPDIMKLGVWYLSVTLLLFLFFFFVARGVIFVVLWVCGYNFWILPNILDDEVRRAGGVSWCVRVVRCAAKGTPG
jgi:hypothetical protein